MFDNLAMRLSQTVKNISGRGRLTDGNIKDALRNVRMALLEADVALPVVREFIAQVKNKAIGHDVNQSLTPSQQFVKIVQQELTQIMGQVNSELNLATQPPAVILMVGLQGVGKTTTVAKLAVFLKNKHKKKVLVVSADVYRPAAREQLAILGHAVNVDVFAAKDNQKPIDIANEAYRHAKLNFYDVLIIDTAGRLHVDDEMMHEIKEIHQVIKPIETLFVIDAMTGQDAINSATVFKQTVALTGIILTKVDGDARGGAALSVRYLTGKPIKFLGVGEKTDALEPFFPERLASRILGMGDVLSLIEELQHKVDHKKAEKMAVKLKKGHRFDFNDFLEQLKQMNGMGGMAAVLDKLPSAMQLPDHIKNQINGDFTIKMEAMINSMTRSERIHPEIIKGSRKRRIAAGSGTRVQDVNRMLKQFSDMQQMAKKMKGGGMLKMMQQIQGLGSRRSGVFPRR